MILVGRERNGIVGAMPDSRTDLVSGYEKEFSFSKLKRRADLLEQRMKGDTFRGVRLCGVVMRLGLRKMRWMDMYEGCELR